MIPANYSTISFPSLGIEVNPGRALALGPLTIHYYGLIIAIGLMLAVVYACRRCSQFGIKQDDLLDGVLWVTPFAILCARAYYCIFSWADYAENPISVLYIWNGGLAIYGGVLGAVAGILLLCRIKKIKIGASFRMRGLFCRLAHAQHIHAAAKDDQRNGLFYISGHSVLFDCRTDYESRRHNQAHLSFFRYAGWSVQGRIGLCEYSGQFYILRHVGFGSGGYRRIGTDRNSGHAGIGI